MAISLISTTIISYDSINDPASSASIAVQTGDTVLVKGAMSSGNGVPLIVSKTGTATIGAFTKRAETPAADNTSAAYIVMWTVPVTAGGNVTITIEPTVPNGAHMGAAVEVWRGVGSVGNAATYSGDGQPSMGITGNGIGSVISTVFADWNAVTGTQTPTTTNGTTHLQSGRNNDASQYDVCNFYIDGVTSTGNITVGQSAPSGQSARGGAVSLIAAAGSVSLDAGVGAMSLTGTDATLTVFANKTLEASTPASYVFDGVEMIVGFGLITENDQAAYSLIGQDLDIGKSKGVGGESGAYVLNGTDMVVGFGLIVFGEGYELVGEAVTIKPTHGIFPAEGGSYEFIGDDIFVLKGPNLPIETGAYAFAGQPVAMARSRSITLDPILFLMQGIDTTFSFTTAGMGGDLPAGIGAYAFTGQDTVFDKTRPLAAGQIAYAFMGRTASLNLSQLFVLDTGSYSLTGTASRFDFIANAGSGAYALTPAVVEVLQTRQVEANAGEYALIGHEGFMDMGQPRHRWRARGLLGWDFFWRFWR